MDEIKWSYSKMLGILLIIVVGIPSLILSVYSLSNSLNGKCIQFFFGPIVCGGTTFIIPLIALFGFLATLYLANLWKD